MSRDSSTPGASARGAFPLFAGAMAFFTVMAGATVPTPLYPIYSDTYGFTQLDITIIFAVYSAGVIGALLLTGPWSDRIGRKPVLLAGLAASLASNLVFLAVDLQAMTVLMLARVLQGISVGLFTSAATVAVGELAPEGRSRLGNLCATAANMGGLGAGSILAGLVVVALPAALYAPYLVHSVLALASVALFWPLTDPVTPDDTPKLTPQGLAVPSEIRGLFVPAAISAFSGFMVCGFMGSVSPSFLGQVLGHQGAYLLIGTVAGLIFLASCLGQIGEEWVPDAQVLPVGMGLLTLGIAAITAALALETLWGLIAAIILSGLGHGIAFKGGLTALNENAPSEQVAAVTATYFTVAYVAISIPVLVIGVLTAPLGLKPSAVGFAAVATLLSLVSFVLILRRS